MTDPRDKVFFNRTCALTINETGQPGFKYTSLKVVFEIVKTSASSSNKAKIDIVNLSTKSRSMFEKKGLQLRLDAGYENMLETLYLGDVVKVMTKRSGPDIITTFEAGSSERTLTLAHFERNYPANTEYTQILKDIAATLDVKIGALVGIPSLFTQKGIAFSGTSQRALNMVTSRLGLIWSVQNNTLQILPKKDGHTGEDAIVLKSDTGLIGVPSRKNDGIEFTALLNPKLLPGSAVYIQTGTISGFFRISKCIFEGDTHGDKWEVRCEATETRLKQIYSSSGGFVSDKSFGTTA